MTKAAHPHLAFIGDGETPAITMRVHNIGAHTAPLGAPVVLWHTSSATGDHSIVHVRVTNSSTLAIRAKVFGSVRGTNIQPGAYGSVVHVGCVTDLMISGAVSAGDFLCLSPTERGYAKITATETSVGFAIALDDNASGHDAIRALILPWRM